MVVCLSERPQKWGLMEHLSFTGVTSVTWRSGCERRVCRAAVPWKRWGRCLRSPGFFRSTRPPMKTQPRSSRDAPSSRPCRCRFTDAVWPYNLNCACMPVECQIFVFLYKNLQNLVVFCGFVDCENPKLLHTHWWFRKASGSVLCPQSAGKIFFLFSLSRYITVSIFFFFLTG